MTGNGTPRLEDFPIPAPKILSDLARHMEWADAVAWKSVLASERARAARRVLRVLCHIHNVQRGFLSVWQGQNAVFQTPEAFHAPSDMMLWARDGHARLQTFLSGVGHERLEAPVHLPWAFEVLGAPADHHPSLEQAILQVITHSSHHRGQLNALLRSVGDTPPLTDFVVWLWRGEPAPPWPAPPHPAAAGEDANQAD